MTRPTTALPVAIIILFILGIFHLYWLMFASITLSALLLPESWDLAARPYNYILAFSFATILSFPFAYTIERLRPKRTIVYWFSGMGPAIVFYGNMILRFEGDVRETSSILLSVAAIFVGLTIAIFVLRRLGYNKEPLEPTKGKEDET